jgi:hypothetical protein
MQIIEVAALCREDGHKYSQYRLASLLVWTWVHDSDSDGPYMQQLQQRERLIGQRDRSENHWPQS